jgi:hypothetical protein
VAGRQALNFEARFPLANQKTARSVERKIGESGSWRAISERPASEPIEANHLPRAAECNESLLSEAATSETFDQARSEFETAWAVFLSKRTEADFQEGRDQRDWTAEKYRLGVMRALNRHVERVFNPSRKDTQWGTRKLKRDQ